MDISKTLKRSVKLCLLLGKHFLSFDAAIPKCAEIDPRDDGQDLSTVVQYIRESKAIFQERLVSVYSQSINIISY